MSKDKKLVYFAKEVSLSKKENKQCVKKKKQLLMFLAVIDGGMEVIVCGIPYL